MERYDGWYAAKFAREAKDNPTEWLILPQRYHGKVVLQYIGPK